MPPQVEKTWCEGSVLDFPYPLSVLSLLVTLHLPKQRLGQVALRVWVKNPSVKGCVTALGPEPPNPDICSGIWVSVGSAVPGDSTVRGCNFGSTSTSL